VKVWQRQLKKIAVSGRVVDDEHAMVEAEQVAKDDEETLAKDDDLFDHGFGDGDGDGGDEEEGCGGTDSAGVQRECTDPVLKELLEGPHGKWVGNWTLDSQTAGGKLAGAKTTATAAEMEAEALAKAQDEKRRKETLALYVGTEVAIIVGALCDEVERRYKGLSKSGGLGNSSKREKREKAERSPSKKEKKEKKKEKKEKKKEKKEKKEKKKEKKEKKDDKQHSLSSFFGGGGSSSSGGGDR
jgi:hypothetical protein